MAYDYGGCLLAALPENSIIIASGDNSMFSLSYLLQVKNMRPDVIAYDDSGYIFPNIYGDGFIKMADMEQDKKRVLIQKQKIYELNQLLIILLKIQNMIWQE